VAPGAGGFDKGGQYATYYDSFVDQLWAANGLTVTKPGPNGGGLGSYPDLSAAIYRHVGAVAGTFDATGKLLSKTLWADASTFYQAAPGWADSADHTLAMSAGQRVPYLPAPWTAAPPARVRGPLADPYVPADRRRPSSAPPATGAALRALVERKLAQPPDR